MSASVPLYVPSREQRLEDAGLDAGAPMGPGIWRYLGPMGTRKPFVPFYSQKDLLDVTHIPWPGIDRTGTPYPTIFAYVCGRRWGKTTMGEKLLWKALTAPDDDFGPPVVRLTADTEEHAKKIWRPFIWHLENTPLKALKDTYIKDEERIVLKTGAEIMLLSAHDPSQLSGDGVTTWLVDEAQELSQEAFDNLYPSTTERDGIIAMFGVAQKEGPFKETALRGQEGDTEVLYKSFPTSSNPYVPQRRIDLASRRLTAGRFKQLYLAQWADEVGAIFRNVRGCLYKDNEIQLKYDPEWTIGFVREPVKGEVYYGGLDLARLSDWTVYTVFDKQANLIAWMRCSLTDWTLIKQRIMHVHKLYNHCYTGVDSTGVGDAVVDDLVNMGMKCEEYPINTNPRKRLLVDKLAVRIGAGRMRYPNIPEMLRELERMRAKRASEGSPIIVYEAPAGMHDDFPLSMALACHVLPDTPYTAAQKRDPMLADPGPTEPPAGGAYQQNAYEYL